MKLKFVLEVLLSLTAKEQSTQSENNVFPQHLKQPLVSTFDNKVAPLVSNVHNN